MKRTRNEILHEAGKLAIRENAVKNVLNLDPEYPLECIVKELERINKEFEKLEREMDE